MKKVIRFSLYMLLSMILFMSCGNKNNTPEAVAEKFIKALLKGDYDTASKYCTEESLQLLSMAISASKMQGVPVRSKFEGVECQVDESGETAICQVQTLEDGQSSSQKLDMVKIDGKWKAVLSKSKN